MNGTDSNMQIQACGCVEYVDVMNCIASHCWNQVYSCAYQELVIDYLRYCPNKGQIPFFPPPDDAPGACSCNVGKIFVAIDNSVAEITSCDNAAATVADPGEGLQLDAACVCCGESATLSSLFSICPNTDPSQAGLDLIQSYFSGYSEPFSSCDKYLSSYNCVSDLGFSQIDGGKYYGPSNLSLSGTQSLSDGPGSITSPISGATFTWVPIDTPVTVVAVSYTADVSLSSTMPAAATSSVDSTVVPDATGPTKFPSAGTSSTLATSPSPTSAPSGASTVESHGSTTSIATSASSVIATSTGAGHTTRASLGKLTFAIIFLGAMLF